MPDIVNLARNQLFYKSLNIEQNLLLPLFYSRIISNCTLNTYLYIKDKCISHSLSKKFIFAIDRDHYKKPELVKMWRATDCVVSPSIDTFMKQPPYYEGLRNVRELDRL